jgi:dTDP-D-glucose 4,6-dehydratase
MADELKVELVESHRPGHDLRYALDTAKINQAGWVAPVDLGESLERTVWWTMQRPQWLHRTL